MIAFCRLALLRYCSVVVITDNRADMLQRLREYFPDNKMEMLECGIRIYDTQTEK